MCGIAGLIRPRAGGDALLADARAMIGCLAHRGPDNLGTWTDGVVALGHARLSIIDRSDAGNQPMSDPSGRYWIVFNGEAYNYRELRPELERAGHRFVTQTDTEVVLHAFMEWGEAALERLNGMWALAIWDATRRELFAARDRAGKKPFYYVAGADGTFHFASEVKAFLALGMRFRAHPQAAFDFIAQGSYGHLGGDGFFAGVSQLDAAHCMRVSPDGDVTIRRYWDLPVVRDRDRLEYGPELRARFRELLIDAVRLRLRADVPVGATLSGGLDSSAVVGIVGTLTGQEPIHLFTSQYAGTAYDESRYFDAVVARLANPIVHRTQILVDSGEEQMRTVVRHQEEPFGDTSILAHFLLMQAARRAGVPVILSGQGGDELLMGYPSLVSAYLGALLASGRWPTAARELNSWAVNSGQPVGWAIRAAARHVLPLRPRDWLRATAVSRQARMLAPTLTRSASLLRFESDATRSAHESYVAQVFKRFSIPHLTHYDDRNAMAFGIEGRMPFLDHRLVELLFSVRYDALFRDGVTKRILRESFPDLLPDIVRERRDKIGFFTPLPSWLRAHRAWVTSTLTRERMMELRAVSPDWILPRLERFWLGHDEHAGPLWRAFVYHLWAEIFEVPAL